MLIMICFAFLTSTKRPKSHAEPNGGGRLRQSYAGHGQGTWLSRGGGSQGWIGDINDNECGASIGKVEVVCLIGAQVAGPLATQAGQKSAVLVVLQSDTMRCVFGGSQGFDRRLDDGSYGVSKGARGTRLE